MCFCRVGRLSGAKNSKLRCTFYQEKKKKFNTNFNKFVFIIFRIHFTCIYLQTLMTRMQKHKGMPQEGITMFNSWYICFIMVIKLSGVQFGLKSYV